MADDPFLVAVDAWIEKAHRRADRIVQVAAEMALERIKELTPVKTGYLRANWAVVRGRGLLAIEGARAEDSERAILTLQAGDSFSLVNPTVYAHRINYGFVGVDKAGRSYDVPGVHMIEQVVTELPNIFAKAAAQVAAET